MNIRRSFRSLVIALPLVGAAAFAALGAAQNPEAPGDPLIAGFKSTYPASVSDAVELVTGKNGTMRYDMKLMTGANLVGRAVTALARPALAEQATPALSTRHSVEMIDEAKPGDVGVIVMEGTLDIAAMGNLMATAAVDSFHRIGRRAAHSVSAAWSLVGESRRHGQATRRRGLRVDMVFGVTFMAGT